jgi:PAS domain S-box-containing protein
MALAICFRQDNKTNVKMYWPLLARLCSGRGDKIMVTDQQNGNAIVSKARLDHSLRASELSYRRLFEASQDGILILDVDTGRITDVNPFLYHLLGFPRSEMVGKTIGELSPFKDMVSNRAMLEQLQKDGYVRYHNLPLETRDGRHIDVEFVSNVYQAGDKKVIQCNIRDIKERKLADEKVHELLQAVEQCPVSIVFTDITGKIEYVNRKFTEVTGYTSEQAVGQNPRILKSGVFPPANYKQLWDAITGGKTWSGEFHNRKKNGELYWEQATISPVFDASGKLTHFLAVKEDITERKRSADLLRQSEERYRSLIDSASSAIFTIAPDGTFTSLNPAVEVMSGVSRSDWMGKSFSPMVHPDDLPLALKMFDLALKGENPPVHELRANPSLKRPATMEMTLTAQKDERGKIIGVLGIGYDVTARKQLQEEMPWKNALLEAQVESALDGILVVDSQGKKILQNERMNKLWKIPSHVAHDKDDTAELEFVASQTKNPKEFAAKVAYLYSHQDETSRDEIELVDGTILDRYSSPVRGKDGKYFGRIWTFRDVTARLKLELEFRQSQKMDAIGQLAGGVAHDFNNILGVIQLQAGLLMAEKNISPQQLDFATEIEKATEKAANLTRQLLMFSRRQKRQTRDLDLNQSINEMTKMLRRTLGENIQLQFKFAMQPLIVHADAGMMDQVLMNLAINARDAMPKGGLLTIETFAVDFDESVRARSAEARPGAFVCLSVTDTGCGIAPENQKRIFEPFFTTKDVGKGTGLGLSTVFGIVHLHQGWIEFQSEVGRGTTFRIYLPRLASISGEKTEAPTSFTSRGGNETILIVEDDVSLSASLRKVLSQLGYNVMEAANGAEAVEIWKKNRDQINLVLTDVVMPGGMSGIDLGRQLLKEKPELKIIYASGYSAEILDKDCHLEEGVNFLTKPFEMQKLSKIIRDTLDTHLKNSGSVSV